MSAASAASAALTRRQALAGGLASGVAGGLCLCCLPGPAAATGAFTVEEVAQGVFVRRGPDAEATPQNLGGIANIGFIIGREAVLVTDAGGSRADGLWLRDEIRARTDLPVTHVVASHVHPDHAFGASAFAEDGAAVVGHHRLAAALAARGDYYRARLAEILGPEAAGRPVAPTLEVGEEGAAIDLGGRVVRLWPEAVAHTDCDLVMRDEASGILFPADLLFVGRVPALDGSLVGWIAALERLRQTGAAQAVPGHGPALVALAPALDGIGRYLAVLRDETRAAVAAGVPIDEAAETVGQGERARWALFDQYQGRNVLQAYKELEWE